MFEQKSINWFSFVWIKTWCKKLSFSLFNLSKYNIPLSTTKKIQPITYSPTVENNSPQSGWRNIELSPRPSLNLSPSEKQRWSLSNIHRRGNIRLPLLSVRGLSSSSSSSRNEAPRGMIFPIVGIKLFGNERRMKKPELRRRYVWLPVANVHGGVGGRVGVDLAPSNPAGSIPRHPMARRAKALPVIRADPNTRDLFLLSTEEAAFVRSFFSWSRGCYPRETPLINYRLQSIESILFLHPVEAVRGISSSFQGMK